MSYNPNPAASYAGVNMNKFGDEKSAKKHAQQMGYLLAKESGNKDIGVQLAQNLFATWKLSGQRQQDAAAGAIFKDSKGLFKPGALAKLRIRTPEEFRLSNGGLSDARIPLTDTQRKAAALARPLGAGLNIPVA